MTTPIPAPQPGCAVPSAPCGSLSITQPCAQLTPASLPASKRATPKPQPPGHNLQLCWQPLAGAAAARLAVACTALYRHAVRSGDPALYDAAAVMAALQAQDVAQRPITPSRVRAALDAARHAYRLDLNLQVAPESG